ncbi:hypothetical protein [Streptomyces sp. NPDC002265]|uniref:hypothetical protein n=1 Tax=Streptomyces sp. NPDC002265 TaxID=3154415 RepID=UPI00331DCB3E
MGRSRATIRSASRNVSKRSGGEVEARLESHVVQDAPGQGRHLCLRHLVRIALDDLQDGVGAVEPVEQSAGEGDHVLRVQIVLTQAEVDPSRQPFRIRFVLSHGVAHRPSIPTAAAHHRRGHNACHSPSPPVARVWMKVFTAAHA